MRSGGAHDPLGVGGLDLDWDPYDKREAFGRLYTYTCVYVCRMYLLYIYIYIHIYIYIYTRFFFFLGCPVAPSKFLFNAFPSLARAWGARFFPVNSFVEFPNPYRESLPPFV